ncbi:hypothetical protein LXL04_012547 [Taraxacum kok-saghyz]
MYNVEVYPTLLFFIDGVHKPYNGTRNKLVSLSLSLVNFKKKFRHLIPRSKLIEISRNAIVNWVKKKIGPGLHNLTTTEEAETILTRESPVVVAFVENLAGPNISTFYQTSSADVAKLFHIDPLGKRPALVLLKKEDEKVTHFGGQFVKSAIAEFVSKNKPPLVIYYTRATSSQAFENPINNQVILFTTLKDKKNFLPIFQEAAKYFMGKALFVYVSMEEENAGKRIAECFGINGDAPKVIAFTGNEDSRKFLLEGDLTLNNIKSFGTNFLEDNLKPFYKSDPIPETNDGDVKIVVGNNFDEIVLDESKDVLLEFTFFLSHIYAEWCEHCQALEPTYNKLAKHLRGIGSLVNHDIAKMDGTTNEHPRAMSDGFPNTFYTERTMQAFYKFLKQHAAIPFQLQNPESTQRPETAYAISPAPTPDPHRWFAPGSGPAPGPPPVSPAPELPPPVVPAPPTGGGGGGGGGVLPNEDGGGSSGLSGGQKAGITIGVLAGAGLIGFATVVYMKRRSNVRRARFGASARSSQL